MYGKIGDNITIIRQALKWVTVGNSLRLNFRECACTFFTNPCSRLTNISAFDISLCTECKGPADPYWCLMSTASKQIKCPVVQDLLNPDIKRRSYYDYGPLARHLLFL